jgi:PAS domain S-box-containing protein
MSDCKDQDAKFKAIFKNSLDAQFIIDAESGRILDANIAAHKFLDYHRSDLLNKRFTDLIPPMPEKKTQKALDEIKHFGGVFTQEFLKAGGEVCIMDMTLTMIPWDSTHAFIATLRDVSERLKFEEERERLINELREALDNIKTLKGLLPICANCKKIRNDDGY